MAVIVALAIYWGVGGEYGPIDEQEEGEWAGWPDFGRVLRYFRKKARLTAKQFGVIYGRYVNPDGSPITERQIRRMELENQVPLDMNRRKLIVRLLNIPPMLFGLAVLEDIVLQPHSQAADAVIATGQTKLVKVAVDTTKYQDNLHIIWKLHESSNAISTLSQLNADICDLESLEKQTLGDLRYHVQGLLFDDHIAATHVVRDQRQFSRAYHHANQAVRVAKSMVDSDLIATALFTRGWTRLEWGLFGTISQDVFQVQQDKLSAAVHDFQEANAIFPSQDGKEMHPQLQGFISLFLSRAQSVLAASKIQKIPASSLLALDGVEGSVNKENIDDQTIRIQVTGTTTGLHQAAYLSNRATAFNAARIPGEALQDLNALGSLVEKTYERNEIRQLAWLNILKANTYMALGEYSFATQFATQALLACQDIRSVTNTAIVTDIYGRLLRSNHKASSDVQELGDILRESPVTFIEPEE